MSEAHALAWCNDKVAGYNKDGRPSSPNASAERMVICTQSACVVLQQVVRNAQAAGRQERAGSGCERQVCICCMQMVHKAAALLSMQCDITPTSQIKRCCRGREAGRHCTDQKRVRHCCYSCVKLMHRLMQWLTRLIRCVKRTEFVVLQQAARKAYNTLGVKGNRICTIEVKI